MEETAAWGQRESQDTPCPLHTLTDQAPSSPVSRLVLLQKERQR